MTSRQRKARQRWRASTRPINTPAPEAAKPHEPLKFGDPVMIKQGTATLFPGARGVVERLEYKFGMTHAIIKLRKLNAAGLNLRVRVAAEHVYVLADGETRPERPKITVEHLVPYNELLGKVG